MKLFTARRDDAHRRLPDAGPSSIRYLSVLSGATFAVIAVGAVMPSIGHNVRSSFCGRGDTGCAAHAIPTGDLGVCRVLSHADTVTDDAVVFTDDLGQSGRLTLSRTVDKQAVVHWFVRQDGVPWTDISGTGISGNRVDVTAAAGGQLTEFASEDAAREYITSAQHQPVRRRLVQSDPTGLVTRLADTIDGHRVASQPPDAFFVDGGNALELGKEARSGVNGDVIAGGMTGVAEVKVTRTADPVTTLYVRLSSDATAALGLQRPGVPGVSKSPGLGVASISFDATGRASRLVIEAAGQLPARLGPPFGGAGPNVMAGLIEPGPKADDGQFTGRVSMSIDLTDEQTAGIAADALHSLGVPLLLDQGSDRDRTDRPVRRLYRLLDQGTADTSVTVNTYRRLPTSNSTARVTLGLQGGLTIAGALPDKDYYYAPGQGFVQWQTCG